MYDRTSILLSGLLLVVLSALLADTVQALSSAATTSNNIPTPTFHQRLDAVTSNAQQAICAVMGDKLAREEYNFRHLQDRGRIGLEIEGAKWLLTNKQVIDFLKLKRKMSVIDVNSNNNVPVRMNPDMSMPHDPDFTLDGHGLRMFALELAAKLSYCEFDDEGGKRRQVIVYFNDEELTTWADHELCNLRNKESRNLDYKHISLCNLGEPIPFQKLFPPTDEIDASSKKIQTRRRNMRLKTGGINPSNGIILVVQPISPDKDKRGIDSFKALERLCASASFSELPVILLSPRLNHMKHINGGIDTGYEDANTYGGNEPAMPTPWLMRDFLPPAFAWISPRSNRNDDHVALYRSVIEEGQCWHLFHATPDKSDGVEKGPHAPYNYQYYASVPAGLGRPSMDIVHSLKNMATSFK